MQWFDPPTHLGVKGYYHLGERQDRITPVMGIGAVGGLSLEGDLNGVIGGIHHPRIEGHRSPGQLGLNVGSHHCHRCQLRELAPEQFLGARRVGLLARLEDGEQGGGECLPQLVGSPGDGEERRHMDVMSAGVHRRSSSAEGSTRALLHPQPVELGSDGYRPSTAGAH